MNELNNFNLASITDKKLISYIKRNKTVKLKGYNYTYLNAYSNEKEASGIQLTLSINKQTKEKKIVFGHTNDCIWNFKINTNKEIGLDEDYYLVDSNIYGELNKPHNTAIVKINNKDILPSLLHNDIIKAQVSGLAEDVRLYKDKNDPNQKFNYLSKHKINDKADIMTYIDRNKINQNIIKLGDKVGIAGIIKEVYTYKQNILNQEANYLGVLIDTLFGELMLYFSANQISYKVNVFPEKGDIIECIASLVADAYLNKEEFKEPLNEDYNFRLFRRAFTEENFKCLEPVLSNDCEYISDKFYIKGKKSILKTFNKLSKNKVGIYMDKVCIFKSHYEIDDLLPGKECGYYIQKNCDKNYLCYINCNEENKINFIHMCNDEGYAFVLDYPKKYLDDLCLEELNKNKKLTEKEVYSKIYGEYFDSQNQTQKVTKQKPISKELATKIADQKMKNSFYQSELKKGWIYGFIEFVLKCEDVLYEGKEAYYFSVIGGEFGAQKDPNHKFEGTRLFGKFAYVDGEFDENTNIKCVIIKDTGEYIYFEEESKQEESKQEDSNKEEYYQFK